MISARHAFVASRLSLRRAIVVGALAFLATGCVSTTAPFGIDLGDYEAAPRDLIGVNGFTSSFALRVSPKGYISKTERARLDTFIAEFAENRPESLRVMLQGRATPAQRQTIRSVLAADGVDPKHVLRLDEQFAPSAARGTILVAVQRAIAIDPNCPGSMGHPSAPADNLTEPNFGCADASNFAAMIGDPHHLREPGWSIYYDGERGASDVAAYRADKVKPLPTNNVGFEVK
jgi:pilus biogenesis lipoprotein CpaD